VNKDNFSVQKDRLGFLSIAKAAFKFIESHGFKVTKEDFGFLRYESDLYFINICHGRFSYEINVEMGYKCSEAVLFYLGDIIEMADPKGHENYFTPMAVNEETVYKFIEMHAQWLKKYGENILNGDVHAWAKLRNYHKEKIEKYWDGERNKEIRERAGIAFREKRYDDFIKLILTTETELTKLERKQLEYARKKTEG
jgi:hypothetical protein